jgi:hypothetical protein
VGSPGTSGTSRSTALVPHAAQRADRGAAQVGGHAFSEERGDRFLERGEPEPAGGVECRGGDRRILVGEPAVHERQEPDVAKAAAHRGDHAASIGGCVGDARGLEERECGALRSIPLGAERATREVTEQATCVEAVRARRRFDRGDGQRRDGVQRAGLAVLEADA